MQPDYYFKRIGSTQYVVYMSGYKAGLKGLDRNLNPHPIGGGGPSGERYLTKPGAWDTGWLEGRIEFLEGA